MPKSKVSACCDIIKHSLL